VVIERVAEEGSIHREHDSAMSASEQIDAYVASLEGWQREIVARLRRLVHEAIPDVVEEWKWSTPVFSRGGQVCAIGVFKDHVKVNVFKGASVADPDGLFNAGLEAKTSRAVDLTAGDPLDEAALIDLLRRASDLNR
jgi:hypothetical protein